MLLCEGFKAWCISGSIEIGDFVSLGIKHENCWEPCDSVFFKKSGIFLSLDLRAFHAGLVAAREFVPFWHHGFAVTAAGHMK